jgi:uncharacterized membrane protein
MGAFLSKDQTTFWQDFRLFFVRGLAAVLPAILTIAILAWLLSLLHTYVGNPISEAMVWGVTQYRIRTEDPDAAKPQETPAAPATQPANGTSNTDNAKPATGAKNSQAPQERIKRIEAEVRDAYGTYFYWMGFVLGVVGVYLFGRFVTSFFGRGVWRVIERAISGLPIFKQVYPSVKQVTDFLLAERKKEYSRVVAVQYPRKGIWSIGLVTSPGMRTLHDAVDGELLSVFIPSSPTPVTGYTVTVRRDEVIDLPISIDEALRFTVSGGVIQPLSERMGNYELKPPGTELLTLPEDKEISE